MNADGSGAAEVSMIVGRALRPPFSESVAGIKPAPQQTTPTSGKDVPIIEPANAEDVLAIAALLRAAELPHEDFAAHIRHFLVARRAGAVIGAIGAEVCGKDALLRSFVVASDERGAGLGGRLVNELDRAADAWGVQRWWLLTTTADSFFARRGFQRVPRTDAPPAIASTTEFHGLCPSIASCLTRERRSP